MVTSTDIAAIHDSLRGAPRKVNIIAEKRWREKREAEQMKLEEERKAKREAEWREEMKRAIDERVKAKKADIANITVNCLVTGRFALQKYTTGYHGSVTRNPMEVIADMVLARHPGYSMGDVRGRSRTADIVAIRCEMVRDIKKYDPASTQEEIAEFMNRERTTVAHMMRKMNL